MSGDWSSDVCSSDLCFCISEKLFWKYSRNWTKINGGPYFTDTYTESKGETEECQEAATQGLGVAPPPAAPRVHVGPSGALSRRPFAYIILLPRNP